MKATQLHISLLKLAKAKAADYSQLVKFRLNLTVVFSAMVGFLMGTSIWEIQSIIYLVMGGFLVTASANAINQIIEKDFDKLMKRTADRPLSANRMTVPEAVLIAGISGIGGLIILWLSFNAMTALLGAISLFSYAFVYTPLKRISPIAVFVGAIPGALPVMIGWVAATGSLGLIAYSLFAIQFLWQFPHFWAIGWLGYDDYKKAGFKLLPISYDSRNKNTAIQIFIYTIATMLVGFAPFIFGLCGTSYLIIAAVTGIFFIFRALQLIKNLDRQAALNVMYASLIYLPLVQLFMLIDKI